MKYTATIEGRDFEIEIAPGEEIVVDGNRLSVDLHSVAGQPIYSLLLGGRSYEALVYPMEAELAVLIKGQLFVVHVEDEHRRRLRQTSGGEVFSGGEFQLKAPMPGLVVDVPVQEGEEIERGQNLVILESMKMQNELKAPRDGVVTRIHIKPGDSIDQNQVMLVVS